MGLPRSQEEGQRISKGVDHGMDFGAQSAFAASDRLVFAVFFWGIIYLTPFESGSISASDRAMISDLADQSVVTVWDLFGNAYWWWVCWSPDQGERTRDS
jgi:hypothetical protein